MQIELFRRGDKVLSVHGVDGEGGKDEVTLLFASVSFNKESSLPKYSVQIDLSALELFGFVVVKVAFDCVRYDLQF